MLFIIEGKALAATEIIPSAPFLTASIMVKSSPEIIRNFLLIFLRNSIILLTSPDASFMPIILSEYSLNLMIVSLDISQEVLPGTLYNNKGIGETSHTLLKC